MINFDCHVRSWRKNAGILMLSSLISMQSVTYAADTAAHHSTGEYLFIEDTVLNQQCSFDISQPRVIQLKDGHLGECNFSWIGEIWFVNVPSAVTVTFIQRTGLTQSCSEVAADYPYRLTLKTAGYSAKTATFTFSMIKALDPSRDVVVPRVRATFIYPGFGGAEASKDVACILVSPSPTD